MRHILLFTALFLSVETLAQSVFSSDSKKNVPVRSIKYKFKQSTTLLSGSSSMITPKQRTCSTVEINEELKEKYNLPSTEEFESRFELIKDAYLKRKQSQRTQETIIQIPVIVHIIHNGETVGSGANISAAQVQSQIDVLNEDFRRKAGTAGFNDHKNGADIGVEFALALRDEFGNELAEPGIH